MKSDDKTFAIGLACILGSALLLFLLFVASEGHCQALPDAPTRSNWHVLEPDPPRQVTFFTLLPDRPLKASIRSPWFIVPNVIGGGLAIWDFKRSEKRYGLQGEFWSERGIPMIVIPAFQLVMDSKISRPVGLLPAGVLIGKSAYSLISGRYQ